MQDDVAKAFGELIEKARLVSRDAARLVEEILKEGIERPLAVEEARALLTRVVDVMRQRAKREGERSTVTVVDRDIEQFIDRVVASREALKTAASPVAAAASNVPRIALQEWNGIEPRAVKPTPIFHEREVPVVQGFVRTRDIRLWDENERIDIHLSQFQEQFGRRPSADELLDLMLGKMKLPGVSEDDEFAIKELASSIAVNGVRKPPIIDTDGKLLDGNRRVTACYYILNNPDFKTEEKKRAEWLQVWQLTEHATEADREAVIVSLNFEPDNKQEWPKYVKARKVFEHWEAALTMEPQANRNKARLRELRREIARRFALGTDEVSKFVEMVGLADEFESYNVADRSRDEYTVKHRAQECFEYFDELGKGKSAGGVNWSLNQDDTFKHLVYDLLFDKKFESWKQIRDLKYVYQNEDAVAHLKKARDEADLEEARDMVDNACAEARTTRANARQLGVNTRVKIFVDWFVELPVKAFKEGEVNSITRENLHGLRDALKLVEAHLGTGGA